MVDPKGKAPEKMDDSANEQKGGGKGGGGGNSQRYNPKLIKNMISGILTEKNKLFVKFALLEDLYSIKEMINDPDIDVNYANFNPLKQRSHYTITPDQLKVDNVTIDYRENEGWTALTAACFKGNLEMAQFLLADPRVDPTLPNVWGETPLHLASLCDKPMIISLLLARKVDINAQRNDGKTPLGIATIASSLSSIDMLLANPDVNVNIQDKDGYTPLHLACRFGRTGSFKRIFPDLRVDVNILSNSKDHPLISACRTIAHEIVSLLLKSPSVDIEALNTLNENPFYTAVKHGRDKVVKVLLSDLRVEVNKPDVNSAYPIHVAAKTAIFPVETFQSEYHSSLGLLLTSKRVNLNAQNSEGMTALFWACKENHPKLVFRLAKCPQIDVNITDEAGRTPFWVTVTKSGFNCIIALLMCPKELHVDRLPAFTKLSVLEHLRKLDRQPKIIRLVEMYLKDPVETRKLLLEKKNKIFDDLVDEDGNPTNEIYVDFEKKQKDADIPNFRKKIAKKREREKEFEEEVRKREREIKAEKKGRKSKPSSDEDDDFFDFDDDEEERPKKKNPPKNGGTPKREEEEEDFGGDPELARQMKEMEKEINNLEGDDDDGGASSLKPKEISKGKGGSKGKKEEERKGNRRPPKTSGGGSSGMREKAGRGGDASGGRRVARFSDLQDHLMPILGSNGIFSSLFRPLLNPPSLRQTLSSPSPLSSLPSLSSSLSSPSFLSSSLRQLGRFKGLGCLSFAALSTLFFLQKDGRKKLKFNF